MPKISELPVLAEAAADDIVPLVDTSGSVTNKVTRSGLVTGGFPLIATAGTAAGFTLALPTSLTNAAGQSFNIRFHLAPSAGATIAIDGQAALALRLYDGAGALTALVAGDVAIDSIVTLTLIDDGGTLRAVVNRDRSLERNVVKAFSAYNLGTNTELDSENISSFTDAGTGLLTLNFTNAFSTADITMTGSGAENGSSVQTVHSTGTASTTAYPTRNTFANATSNGTTDGSRLCSGFFGDLA